MAVYQWDIVNIYLVSTLEVAGAVHLGTGGLLNVLFCEPGILTCLCLGFFLALHLLFFFLRKTEAIKIYEIMFDVLVVYFYNMYLN